METGRVMSEPRSHSRRRSCARCEVAKLMGIAGAPVQVRNPEAAKIETADGPFMTSSLPVAGFAIVEAADLVDAIEIVSRTPCAVAHGVVEVWPLEQLA
jgi:hypothetical protein